MKWSKLDLYGVNQKILVILVSAAIFATLSLSIVTFEFC